MASNLDYLNPALLPLEEKVKAYLEAEEELKKTQIEARSLATTDLPAAADGFEQRPPTGSFDQHSDELQQRLNNMITDLDLLRREIIELLPVRDEFIKLNLGYGPSRVGAFVVPTAPGTEPKYQLRVIH
ncbi:hypothetical protein SAMN00120144_3254 [Hymenobacter roseosalivarius DSM 11622]|uniref:Uncharacterized protein n=1 Tax=Hymenobacter roseosalivarius DSM 11622 TaxID=645990 RepID=A0A1W1W4Y1_9BACT|nr:hypothetical protein [Hymenobacter roseosalivarius]SMC00441.1 hypothetical protein SAMN00120144_3254 [Hymenobacter roseosalivarius DSM 11622]